MARRRQSGEGSIYQRASNGLWVGSITVGWEGDKRIRKSISGEGGLRSGTAATNYSSHASTLRFDQANRVRGRHPERPAAPRPRQPLYKLSTTDIHLRLRHRPSPDDHGSRRAREFLGPR